MIFEVKVKVKIKAKVIRIKVSSSRIGKDWKRAYRERFSITKHFSIFLLLITSTRKLEVTGG
jgi:hypothetical protein